jgi:phage gp46-like protein
MLFVKNTDIRTSIYNSINIKKGSFFQNPDFGSELSTIKKLTASNLLLAKQYIDEALAWLLATGRAASIDTIVERDDKDISRLNIKITATQPDGLIVTYTQFKRVV